MPEVCSTNERFVGLGVVDVVVRGGIVVDVVVGLGVVVGTGVVVEVVVVGAAL